MAKYGNIVQLFYIGLSSVVVAAALSLFAVICSGIENDKHHVSVKLSYTVNESLVGGTQPDFGYAFRMRGKFLHYVLKKGVKNVNELLYETSFKRSKGC